MVSKYKWSSTKWLPKKVIRSVKRASILEIRTGDNITNWNRSNFLVDDTMEELIFVLHMNLVSLFNSFSMDRWAVKDKTLQCRGTAVITQERSSHLRFLGLWKMEVGRACQWMDSCKAMFVVLSFSTKKGRVFTDKWVRKLESLTRRDLHIFGNSNFGAALLTWEL